MTFEQRPDVAVETRPQQLLHHEWDDAARRARIVDQHVRCILVSLPYGSQTDRCRNVMAAGMCKLTWRGHTYQLERPEIISGSQVFPALPVWQRILMQGGGIHNFVWLHKKEVNTGNQTDTLR